MTETASTNYTADFFKPYELNPNFPNLAGANRMERAHEILKGKKAVKKVAKNTFAVKSQMGVSTYTVSRNGDAYTCNCPDCIVHGAGWECKHIMAVKEFLNESITTATPKKNTQRNWTGYTLGQVNEEELVKIFLRQLCDTVESPAREAGKAGRKAIPLSELVFCSVMKVYSKKSSRRAHTALRDASEQNLLEYAPNYNAVNKFMVKMSPRFFTTLFDCLPSRLRNLRLPSPLIHQVLPPLSLASGATTSTEKHTSRRARKASRTKSRQTVSTPS